MSAGADGGEIRVEGIEPLLAKLERLGKLEAGIAALKAGAEELKGEASRYPPAARFPRAFIYNRTFKTEKQRRFFFWALRSKVIQVPYRRGTSPGSERHKASWTVREEAGGLRQVIGSDTSYGPLIQSRARQTLYHKRVGWRTVEEIAEREGPKVVEKVIEAIKREVEG